MRARAKALRRSWGNRMPRKNDLGGIAVGWKWLAGILTSVLILGAAAWMTSVSSDGKEQRIDIAALKAQVAEKAAAIQAIQKDVEIIKDSQKEQRQDQKQQQQNIDAKLEKLKELLQDERFKVRSRAN
jgi:gas vesicle protein